jgi:hypothetical protein
MHIVLVADFKLPVHGYGGTERVVTWLSRALVQMGHRVTLIAAHGTRMPEATVVTTDLATLRGRDFDVRPFLPSSFDILHSHRDLPVVPSVPWVWTLHGNPPPGTPLPPETIFLSANHASRYGGQRYVHNGLDLADYRFRRTKDDYDLFIGRLHSVKGHRLALEATKRTGRRLVLAGGWRPTLGRRVSYIRSVGGERKIRLLAGARCLWMPAQWDEPFGLTLIESLASGTPVLGTHRGALPEIITPEVGFMGDTVDELVEGVATIARIDPDACRLRVEQHFTHLRMAGDYLKIYRTVAAGA